MKYITIRDKRINLEQLTSYHPYEERQVILNVSETWYFIAFRTHDLDTCFNINFLTDQIAQQKALELLDYYSSTRKDIE